MSARTVAVLRGPNSYFAWELTTGEYVENTHGPLHERTIATIIAHRPHGDAQCRPCKATWPCKVIRVMEEIDFIAAIVHYGTREES